MPRRRPTPAAVLAAGLVALAAVAASPPSAAAQRPAAPEAERRAAADNRVPGRYIVVYADSVGSVDAETDRQERDKGFRARFRYRHALRGFAARLSDRQVERLRADPGVALVASDRTVRALGEVPLAPGEPTPPPGVRRIGAATTTTTRQAADSAVAVIDTGIDLDHPDLNAVDGTDCVAPGTPADDDEGHGTHVAGTIGARNDGAGVVGVAPGTRLYAVKVLDAQGSGTWSQVICGIDWVTQNAPALDIDVANMSLGGPGSNDRNCGLTNGDPLHQAVCRSTQAGILHVVAAGNDGWDLGDDPPDVPAAFPEVLTVAAMGDTDGSGGAAGPAPSCTSGQSDDAYATFSNYASRAADAAHMVAAPGVCIRSTLPGGYGVASGTSMASPHVAGAAALCRSEGGVAGPCAGMSPAQTIEHLRAQAEARTAADPAYGFAGDPSRPNRWGDHFGYLVATHADTTPPDTTIASGPPALTNDSTPTFRLTASEPGAGFECRLDGGAWAACAAEHTTGALADGSHVFEARARDAAGNPDPTPAAATFTVDTRAPAVSVAEPAAGAATSDATPELAGAAGTASGDAATVTVTVHAGTGTGGAPLQTHSVPVSGGAWRTDASPALADGTYTVRAAQADAAGNGASATSTFAVDTAVPDTSIPAGPSGLTNDRTPTFELASDEPAATFECRVDSGAWATCASPHTTAALADGDRSFAARARDAAGNVDATPATRLLTVDATAPETTITSGPSDPTKDTTPTFDFEASEGGATFECRLDGGAWAACSSPHRTAELATGRHTFEVRARDAAANVDATPAAHTFTIDPEEVAARPPRASSGVPATVGETTATVTGAVNPNGQPTTYRFEYGTSSAYGASTAERDAGAGTADVGVSATLTGLAPGTTYHYRVVATNASGTATGADRTFTTVSPPPPPAPEPAPSPPPPAPAPDPPAEPSPPADTTPPAVRLGVTRAQRLGTVRRRGLRTWVRCSEACSVSARLWLDRRTARRLGIARRNRSVVVGRASTRMTRAGRRVVYVRLTRRARSRLARTRAVTVRLRVTVRDLAGNRRTLTRRVRLRR